MSGNEEDKRDPQKKGGGESVRKGREKEKSQKTAMTMKRYYRKTNDIFLGSFHGFPSPCLLFRIKNSMSGASKCFDGHYFEDTMRTQ